MSCSVDRIRFPQLQPTAELNLPCCVYVMSNIAYTQCARVLGHSRQAGCLAARWAGTRRVKKHLHFELLKLQQLQHCKGEREKEKGKVGGRETNRDNTQVSHSCLAIVHYPVGLMSLLLVLLPLLLSRSKHDTFPFQCSPVQPPLLHAPKVKGCTIESFDAIFGRGAQQQQQQQQGNQW